MDKLDNMFNLQNKLQERLGTWDKISTDESMRQQFVNQMILACQEECVEIMKETAYKNPKYMPFGWKQTQEWDVKNYKEEIVDLFHFVMNLSLAVGMEANEFYEIYCKKNNVNHIRQSEGY